MKFHEKIKFKVRQHSYGYKNIKSFSRDMVKKIEEIDKYLDEEINNGKKRKRRKRRKK